MVCKNMSIVKTARRQRAMTLVEVMVAVGISSIVLTAIAALSVYTARSFAALTNYVDLNAQSRIALDNMTWKIRNTAHVTAFSANSVTFGFTAGSTNSLTYTYSPTTKKLTENWSGQVSVLLEDCDSFTFSAYQRNTTGGTFDQVATTDTNMIKEIQMSWVCSRRILGTLVHSESVQSAKIVIRN